MLLRLEFRNFPENMVTSDVCSHGGLGRGERTNQSMQRQLRAFRAATNMAYKTDIDANHVLMGWCVPHVGWAVSRMHVKGSGLPCIILEHER